MIMFEYKRLMAPEPEATGTGDGGNDGNTEATENKQTEQEETSPFNIEMNEEGSEQKEETAEETEAVDFKLTLNAELGVTEAESAILTKHAATLGVDAETASKFINDAIGDMRSNMMAVVDARKKEDEAALRKAWGDKFDSRVKSAGNLLSRALSKAGFSKEDAALFQSAQVFRLIDGVRQLVATEDRPSGRGAPATAPLTGKALMHDMMHNTDNPAYDVLHHPHKYSPAQRIAVAKKYNEAAGIPGLWPER